MEFGKKKLGFGFMRLPMIGDQVDTAQCMRMVDAFLERGFCYFDTAHPYLQGRSEQELKKCLTSRYPRDRYILTNKLSHGCFSGRAGVEPFLDLQLDRCGVEWFDLYLLHAMDEEFHEEYLKDGIYDEVQRMKAAGKVRHVGMSFHDSAEVLDRILTDRPELEAVQIQLNFVDMEDPRIQSRKCWEVCRKHGKPMLIMEPVKGGTLAALPADAAKYMTQGSPASYAIRYAAGFEGVEMVLSGMSDMGQLLDNTAFMADPQPLTWQEQQAIDHARTVYQAHNKVPCTACRYCTDGCPEMIHIPAVFAAMNDKDPERIRQLHPERCIACGQCQSVCPQKLQIPQLLQKAMEL